MFAPIRTLRPACAPQHQLPRWRRVCAVGHRSALVTSARGTGMTRPLRSLALTLLLAVAPQAEAADFHIFTGGSFISGDAAEAAADGWSLGFGGITNRDEDIAWRWDVGFDSHDMRKPTDTNVLADDGDLFTTYLRVGPQFEFEGYDTRFYINAMVGYYWTSASVSREISVPGYYCDPFWGWCWYTTVPGEQILDRRSAQDWGYSATIGYEWDSDDVSFFLEVQYHLAAQETRYSFSPVVIGVRW